MSQPSPIVPERFLAAYCRIERLEQYDRCLAAFIFGSLARGAATGQSDLDVQVIVDEDNPCTNVNHPIIGGVKLDLTFISMRQLRERTRRELVQRERVPIVAESIIVFDKTNELAELQKQASHARPKEILPEEVQFLQFMFYHGNNKAERNLEADPVTALFVMHVGLDEFLKYHYQLHQRWWVSSKRMLADLRDWDPLLARLIEQFIATCEVHEKYAHWSAIIDHILEPLGGRQPIAENNCNCAICRQDLEMLSSDQGLANT